MNGILIPDMPMADYLAIEACSSGAAKALGTASPYAWRNRPKTSSPAQVIGTAVHVALLEPLAFGSRYVVQPPCDLRTNAGKEALVEWLSGIVGQPTVRPPARAAVGVVMDLYLTELRARMAQSGMATLSDQDYSSIMGMVEAVESRTHTAACIHAEGQAEITGHVIDPDYDIPVKVRPDKLLSGQPIVLSLKTCSSVADREYLRTAWAYGYHGAAWFYARALALITGEPHRYWEIAVESAPPHDVLLLEYTDREIQEGEVLMRRGMEQYCRCTQAGIWPGAGWHWDGGNYTIRPIGRQSEAMQ